MRILSLIDCLLTGGGQHIMYCVMRGLSQHRHLVGYMHPAPGDGATKELLARSGYEAVLVNPGAGGYWPDYAKMPPSRVEANIAKLVKQFRPHVVLRHFWEGRETAGDPVPLPRPAWTFPRPKYVCVVHDHFAAPAGYDHYVPTSHDNDRSYQTHIPERKKTVIYNGIDVPRFDVARGPHKGVVIGRHATLIEKKVPADYIDWLSTFDIPGGRFVFAGDGPRRSAFEERARALGVSDRFEFLGSVEYEKVPGVLSGFDFVCYVTDTHVETHSMAMIECAVAGLPVVAEPRGSLPEQVVHGETGLLSSSRDEIRGYCELLARDNALRSKMSDNAREFGRPFTLKRQADAYENLIRSLASNRWL